MVVRPLHISDFNKGYLKILSQLTAVGNVTQQAFESKCYYCITYVFKASTLFVVICYDAACIF